MAAAASAGKIFIETIVTAKSENSERHMKCLIATLLFGASYVWHPLAHADCKLEVTEIKAAIETHGAENIFNKIRKNSASWSAFTGCIVTGQAEWLQLAVVFAPYMDVNTRDGFNTYLGAALANNAEDVLRITGQTYDLYLYCGALPDEKTSLSSDLNELANQLRGIQKIRIRHNKKLRYSIYRCKQVIDNVRSTVIDANL
jgi:hypothetical protein